MAGTVAERFEWLSHSGAVLAVSDYENKARYLHFVSEHRAPVLSIPWEYLRDLLLLTTPTAQARPLRAIEYQRCR